MLAIVIPYYKITFFKETLDSLACQTDKRFKVYIGDDASSENPSDLLDKYIGKFDFVYKRFNENIGSISLVKQWERCIAMIEDEKWIQILGDDDVMSNNLVEEFYNKKEYFSEKSLIIRFKSVIANENSVKMSEFQTNQTFELAVNIFIRKIKTQIRSSLSEYVFKRETLKRHSFKNYPLGWYSDDKALIDFSEGSLIYSINSAYIDIRVSELSISGKNDNLELKIKAKINFYFDLICENLNQFKVEDKKLLLFNYEYIKRKYDKINLIDFVFVCNKYFQNQLYKSLLYFIFKEFKKNLNSIFKKLNNYLWKIKFFYYKIYNKNFNKVIKKQNINVLEIPIIIINFNNLSSLKKLILFLKKRNFKKIIIIDNNSSYKPLLEYYSEIVNEIEIIRNERNEGHRVFWKNKKISNKFKRGYYVITDSDIEPDKDCPEDFLIYFKEKLDKYHNISKVGFSLKLNDIPDDNIHKSKIIEWESKFWQNRNKDGDFFADIDTTFALYRPLNQFKISQFYKGIRVNFPYTAKHWGWYINSYELTEEQSFYMKTVSKSSSWRVDDYGNLVEKHYE